MCLLVHFEVFVNYIKTNSVRNVFCEMLCSVSLNNKSNTLDLKKESVKGHEFELFSVEHYGSGKSMSIGPLHVSVLSQGRAIVMCTNFHKLSVCL